MYRPQATILCLTLLSTFLVNALNTTNVCKVRAKRKDESCYDLKTTCKSAINYHLVYDEHSVLRAGSLKQTSFPVDPFENITVSGLQYIEPGGFQGLEDITTLVILNDYFDIIEHDMFKHLDNLENLVIGGNYTKIINIQNEAFHNLRNLVNLTLSNNAIYNIQAEIFKGLINVTHLDLSHNELKQLSPYSFSDLHSLENLQVQNNNLTRVSKRAFNNLTNLRFIDLRDNLIKVIEEPLFGNDEIPVVLDLTGNPLLCDCRMSWISSWLNISDRKIYGRCHAPKELENSFLSDVYNSTHGLQACSPNNSVITHKVGTLLELPCSGVDCNWTTPDGTQLSEHGERQGPYILTNYDALVIDSSDSTASSINGSYSYSSWESGHQNLNVQFQDGQDGWSTVQIIVVTLACSLMVIVVISLIYKVKSTRFRENEENTPLVSLNPYLSGSNEENTPLISSHSSYLSGSTEENTPLVSSHSSYLSGLNEEKILLISSHSSYLSGSNEISSDQLGTKHYSYAIRKNTDHSGSDNSI